MDGGHLAVADADRLMQDLHHRRQAVGGAGGGRGQQPIFPRILAIIIDADDDVSCARFLHGSRDDHGLRAAPEMAVESLGLQELAGTLQHDAATEIASGRRIRRGPALNPTR